jgi:hypothetical protein
MSILINKHNHSYRILSQYLGYNVYHKLHTYETDTVDKNIESLEPITSVMPYKYDLESFTVKSKSKSKVTITIHSGRFILNYKIPELSTDNVLKYDITIKCMEHKDMVYDINEDRPMTTIEFTSLNTAGTVNFKLFLSYVYKYVKQHIENISMLDEDIKIYTNIESYWDELETKTPRTIDTIYLPNKIKTCIIEDIEWFLKEETVSRYHKLGRTHKRIYLFEGIPGSGKTSFIKALASNFGYNIAMINFTDKVTDGGMLRLIRTLPEKTFLILEDIDGLFEERKKNDTNKNTVTFSGILNSLDGIATPDNFICFITTNYKCNLDNALLRPGRIDKIIKFEHANKSQVKDIFKAYMEDEYTDALFTDFYNNYNKLNIKAPVALIQEYLFKYLDNPLGAIENIDEITDIYAACYKKSTDLYT